MNEENVRLLAENAQLRAEIARVEEMIPRFVPYDGEAPKTVEEFNALPEPWRRQVVQRWPGLASDLANKARIAAELEKHDRIEERRRQVLEGLPFKTVEEFNALPEADRRQWAGKITPAQREALAGVAGRDPAEGWF